MLLLSLSETSIQLRTSLPKFARICQNLPNSANICQNLPKSALRTAPRHSVVSVEVDQDYRALKFAAEAAKADRSTVLRAVRPRALRKLGEVEFEFGVQLPSMS